MRTIHQMALFAALATGCGSAPPPKPDPPLITRKSEPFVPRVERPAAEPFIPSETELVRLEDMLAAEAESNELVNAVGLKYSDRKILVVAHVRYPPLEMDDAAHEAAVNEETIARCEQQFQSCVEGEPECDDSAYEGCIRTAYTDPFVYYSSQFGVDCGVLELSRYDALDNGLKLLERRTLEEMVCDFGHADFTPAGADLDGDGGPELVYAYSFAKVKGELESITDVLSIVDAYDLHTQARLAVEASPEAEVEGTTTSVELDTSAGRQDLVVNQITTDQWCPPSGWALSSKFVTKQPQGDYDGVCDMTVGRRVLTYDPANDVWLDPQDAAQ